MINTFKVGTNLDNELVDIFDGLNQKYSNKIIEVFGSIREHARWAARPEFRLPDVSLTELEKHVKLLQSKNIEFNYTLNAPFIGSSEEIEKHLCELERILVFLNVVGIKTLTVSSPLLSKLIHQICPCKFKTELSTIAALTQVSQLKAYWIQARFTKFCMNLEKNRDFEFLKSCAKVAEENGFKINLMVNEFCSTSDVNFSSHCVLRQDCYNLHSVNKTKEDYLKFDGYPMSYCMAGRQIEEYSWLRSRFILPQWLKHYNAIGINHFKITGRTGTTAYIKKITEAYMSEKWTGNLLELWKSLESIYDNQQDDNAHYVDTRLDSNIIDTNNFLGKWIDPVGYIKSQSGLKPIYFNCANVECGKDCVYCKNFYERYLKNEL